MFGVADNRVEDVPELFTSHFHNPGYEFFHAHSPDDPKREPVEFIGKAGDTILWDNRQAATNVSGLWLLTRWDILLDEMISKNVRAGRLMHSGSFNHTNKPRVAVFAGWCHR